MPKKKKDEKWIEYAIKLTGAVNSVFDQDSEFHIDENELNDPENFTQFLHALASAVPTGVYNIISGDDKDQLQFNHTANRLIFKYCREPEEK